MKSETLQRFSMLLVLAGGLLDVSASIRGVHGGIRGFGLPMLFIGLFVGVASLVLKTMET